MDLDEAGWQEQQRRVERWFVRRGLPHLVHRHTAAEHVWTRAFPALVILFALQLAGAVRRDGTGLGARTDALLDVIVVFTGGVALGGSWVGLNRRRGRPLFARPERVGRLEVAVFVLVPIMPALLRRRPADALTIVIVDLVLAGLVYLVTSYGLLPLTRRVLARLPRQTAIVAGLLARTVPLLLVVVGLLFLRADVWQSAGTQSGGAYLMLLALLAGLAVAFLATR